MVQGAQLFKRFRNFHGSGRPSDEVAKEIGAIAIEPDVAERLQGVGSARVWDGGARKVEGVVLGVEDHFDDVGIVQLGGVLEGGGGGDEVDAGIGGEELGQLIDEGGVDEGFVALNIDEVGGVGKVGRGFGDAVGAGGMLVGGHHHGGSEGFGGLFDAGVIGGNDDGGKLLALPGALEDMLEKRLAAELKKGLPGEAAGGPAGGDDSYDLR